MPLLTSFSSEMFHRLTAPFSAYAQRYAKVHSAPRSRAPFVPQGKPGGMRGVRARSGERVFVGGGAVDGWQWNVEQPQVDRELATVMVEVVHHD